MTYVWFRRRRGTPLLRLAGSFTLEISILVDVAMTYVWFRRRRGTPLLVYGPETSRRPDASCLRNTQRFPRKRPERTMRTVPGVIDLRSLAVLGVKERLSGFMRSSAGYHLGCLATTGAATFLSPPFLKKRHRPVILVYLALE